jgi:hypothetical protein
MLSPTSARKLYCQFCPKPENVCTDCNINATAATLPSVILQKKPPA